MNSVIMVGRLTANPDIKYTKDGNKAIAKFNLAVNRRFKQEGQPDVDFFSIVAFGKTADFINKYFHKGMKAVITGELRNNHYTDNKGAKHYSEQIVISTIEFAESKTSMEFVESKTAKENTTANVEGGFISIPDEIEEELPFN